MVIIGRARAVLVVCWWVWESGWVCWL